MFDIADRCVADGPSADDPCAHRPSLAVVIGEPLDWQLLEGRRATRIALHAPHPATIEDAPEELERLREWAVAATVRMVAAFRPRLKALGR